MPKRQRTSESEPDERESSTGSGSLENYSRHPELWFDDGNVILAVKGTLFRVYRGILSAESPVFRDMFSTGQPGEGEMMDGCPVVHLQDALEDVVKFLQLLFKGVQTITVPQGEKNWPLTRALLRMGDKYQVDSLLEEGTSRLEAYFPDDTDDWNALYDGGQFNDDPHVIEMTNIARAMKLDEEIIHRALYRCTQLPTATLLAGCPTDDGTAERLSQDDLVQCIDKREPLHDYVQQLRREEVWNPRCTRCVRRPGFSALGVAYISTEGHDPLAEKDWFNSPEVAKAISIKFAKDGMCEDCKHNGAVIYKEHRQLVLSQLYQFFY
ncbi:hypothetical protein EIP91_004960 [Steccherinum ochraceum]|uniref:BTB domain-containing protein n=1 Tax=Steccherinum ochraceum TaxID=92696 RepID=A0A4V6N737_9APHY|nr:hypothetical protein EIP91_004960 [Steccherinum ochraceum]